jgi:hypothetical protein
MAPLQTSLLLQAWVGRLLLGGGLLLLPHSWRVYSVFHDSRCHSWCVVRGDRRFAAPTNAPGTSFKPACDV